MKNILFSITQKSWLNFQHGEKNMSLLFDIAIKIFISGKVGKY